MKAKIIAVYNKNKQDEPLVNSNGKPYYNLLAVDEKEAAYYDAFYLSEKAYWKIEKLFHSTGELSPTYENFDFEKFKSLEGKTFEGQLGTNDRGRNHIFKYYPDPVALEEKEKNSRKPTDPSHIETEVTSSEDVPF
jgi:hypothetical protein